jgi:hypothetical protein
VGPARSSSSSIAGKLAVPGLLSTISRLLLLLLFCDLDKDVDMDLDKDLGVEIGILGAIAHKLIIIDMKMYVQWGNNMHFIEILL